VRGFVVPSDPNLLDNLIPPHCIAGFTKPIPDAHHKVEQNCCRPTESCLSSYHQPQPARKAFYQVALVSGDAEQLVSLGCLEKRIICLGQICSSVNDAVSPWGSDALKDLAL